VKTAALWRGAMTALVCAALIATPVVPSFAGENASSRASSASTDSDPAALANWPSLLLGTAWYPEQWPESRWEADLQLMEAAQIRFVRITEFAWAKMEPREGQYDFEWLDRAIAAAAKHHIAVVLGTPTATPPAWLTQKYPDTLRIEEDGQRVTHGNRAHASAASPRYLEFCRQIAARMGERYGKNSNVVGWQIDNEYGYAQVSYDDVTRKGFQDWLVAKYKTIDNLNEHWATQYWSEVYDTWSEIPIPIGGHNPGLMLDWKRFVTHVWVAYQQNQIDVLKKYIEPRQFITGNLMGLWDGVDNYDIAKPLTFAAWDDYVGTGHVDPAINGLTHDMMRGLLDRNFWVMETQPGAVNWSKLNNFLNKGEARAMAWQAVGHGADAIGYWQWRSALNGQEEIHGTLLGPDGTPAPFYDEAAQLGADFSKTQAALRDTKPVSEVALVQSYDSRWAIEFQKHTDKYTQIGILRNYYASLHKLAQSVDVVNPYDKLDQYKLVVAPSLNVIPEDLAAHLREYVQNGGHLVLGPRSGQKDQYNALLPQRQPGYLVDVLGGRVEQYYALEGDVPVNGTWGDATASVWAEQLIASSPETHSLETYGKFNGWLDKQPAVLTRNFGKGSITYIGTVLDDKTMAVAADWMVKQSGVAAEFGAVPDGIEVCRREGDAKRVFVLINFKREPQQVTLPHAMTSMLLGSGSVSSVTLPGYGVEVLADAK
jgi:beta-galactosidase